MNHQKIYESIIQKAQFENRKKLKKTDTNYIYYEKHHVLPKCLNGINDEKNLVLLTGREHYICHKLLTYIYKGNKKIANAFCRMTWDKTGRCNISAKDYAYARELKALIPQSKETIKKRVLSNTGKKRTEESKEKTRQSLLGIKHTEERKRNISEAHKGQIAWNKGLHTRTGEHNGMYRKNVYDVWIFKYGKEEADKRKEERRIKLSNSLKGKNKKVTIKL